MGHSWYKLSQDTGGDTFQKQGLRTGLQTVIGGSVRVAGDGTEDSDPIIDTVFERT